MLKRIAWIVVLALLALAAYLALWPVPIRPVAWAAPPAPGYVGAHAPNQRLAGLKIIALGAEEGPEHVAIGPDGRLYAAMASGNILRMAPDGSEQQVFANAGGRVLGFAFDAAGQMIAADAVKGLLAIAPDGKVRVLADKFGGEPIRYADAVVVARGLSFANGIALSQDEQSLFVAETGRYRVWKIAADARDLDLSAGPSAQARVLLDNLPGYPDNLMRGQEGRIWVGLTKPRSAAIDGMAGKPWLREMTLRLPRSLWPVPPAYGHVFAFTEDGAVVADLQDPSGAYPETTAVTETADRMYVQSLHAKGLGWKTK